MDGLVGGFSPNCLWNHLHIAGTNLILWNHSTELAFHTCNTIFSNVISVNLMAADACNKVHLKL